MGIEELELNETAAPSRLQFDFEWILEWKYLLSAAVVYVYCAQHNFFFNEYTQTTKLLFI